MKRRLVAATFAALSLLSIAACDVSRAPSVPSCYEDEVIVGTGQFTRGFWDGYICVPADNL